MTRERRATRRSSRRTVARCCVPPVRPVFAIRRSHVRLAISSIWRLRGRGGLATRTAAAPSSRQPPSFSRHTLVAIAAPPMTAYCPCRRPNVLAPQLSRCSGARRRVLGADSDRALEIVPRLKNLLPKVERQRRSLCEKVIYL